MQVHNLRKSNLSRQAKRVGRGGKRGKTSGRGMKGQNARQGNSKRPEMRDVIKKIPKLRGQGIHGNRSRAIMTSPAAVNVALLERTFQVGETVSPRTLLQRGVISHRKGTMPLVKILGSGELSKKLSVRDCLVSQTAREKITQAGGGVH